MSNLGLPTTLQEAVLYFADASSVCEEIRNRIDSLQRGADWDGEGALAISAEACNAAIEFLEMVKQQVPGLPDPGSISPTELGAIAFCWRNGRRVLLVEAAPNTMDRLYHQWRGDHDTERSTGFEDKDHVIQLLRGLYA
jgi:hypothetical protein